MEANTFIKSFEVEGNKIKNIKFYGDWEISTAGGSGPSVTKYVFADVVQWLVCGLAKAEMRVRFPSFAPLM